MANTLKVEVVNQDVLTHAVICGFDTTNVLATKEGSMWSWTATNDCIANGPVGAASYNWTIQVDGVELCGRAGNSAAGMWIVGIPIRKGQVVSHPSIQAGSLLKFYGIKR